MSNWIVTDSHNVPIGAQCPRLGAFATEDEAAEFISALPDHDSGRYNLSPPMDYDETMDRVAQTYGPKAMDLLSRLSQLLQDEGLVVNGPHDMSTDDYRYSMLVTLPGALQETGIDVTVEIPEQRAYDGDDESSWGINFGLGIVHYGGRIIGGLQPYNYTDEVWVDSRDAEAVAIRWELLDTANLHDAVSLITDALDEQVSV